MDVCAEHYRCSTVLFLWSILSQSYNIFTDRGISAPRNEKKFVGCLNDTDKWFNFHRMYTVQIPGRKRFDNQITLHIATQNADVGFKNTFQINHSGMVL